MPKVSIGLPVYNGGNYLEEAIESILTQSCHDFELIISDNASTDQTEIVCREYASRDKRIKYYRNKLNLGAAANFNKVFYLSKGKYFKWAAADNVLKKDFLKKCVEFLEEESSFILVYTYCIQINEFKNKDRKINFDYFLDSDNIYSRFKHIHMGPFGLSVSIWGLIRREVLASTHLIQPFVKSDDCLLIDLALRGKMGVVPEYLLVLRTHPNAFHAIAKIKKENMESLIQQEKWFNPKFSKSYSFPKLRRSFNAFLQIINTTAKFSQKTKMFLFLIFWEFRTQKKIWIELINWMKYVLRPI